MTETAEEVLAEVYVIDPVRANETISQWLREHVPIGTVALTYTNVPHHTITLPKYWVYEITSATFVPIEAPEPWVTISHAYFDVDLIEVVHHKVIGPIPPCPL